MFDKKTLKKSYYNMNKSYKERSKQLESKILITEIDNFPLTSTSSNIVTNFERKSSEFFLI